MVASLTRGYALTVARPEVAAADLERGVAGLDPRLVRAELAALRPAFLAPDGRPGTLDPQTLQSWAAWETRFHLVARPPDIGQMFDTRFTG